MVASRRPYHWIVRELREHGLIDPPTSALLDDLRVIGNNAAHGDTEFSMVEAKRYKDLSETAILHLRIAIEAAQGRGKPAPLGPLSS
jgi:hypothetical protein